MKTSSNNWTLVSRAAALTLLAATVGHAQQKETPAPQDLPPAPSAVLNAEQRSQLDEGLGRPAGDGFHVTLATAPGPGEMKMDLASSDPLRLSLDDAISLGLDRNVRLLYDRANQRYVRGLTLSVINALIPNLNVSANSQAQEDNLAAMGFSPNELTKFSASGLIPAGYVIPTIVKVKTTSASIKASQVLFSAEDFELYRGTKNETNVVDLQLLTDRGDVVLNVGQLYLQILGDQANLANTGAQEASSRKTYDQAVQRQEAGVGVKLDTLRAQVDYQQRQQDAVSAANTLAKDKIQMLRVLGLPVNQQFELTDTAPFQELAEQDLEAAKTTAYAHRKDYLSLLEQGKLDHHIAKAVRYQRLPTLAFNGFYGVIGVTDTGSYHGNFNAEGSLTFPIFNEAAQRGQQEVIDAQLQAVQQQENSLRGTIEAQIRSSLLDVQAAHDLVKVAQSNVGLAQQELGDEQDRFAAGVDDSLPVVDAQASVTQAQAQLVQALYQYNVAKLQLARNTGVVETRYRTYLGN